MSNLPIKLRAADIRDEGLIYNSWLHSFWDSIKDHAPFKNLARKDYYLFQHKKIEHILSRSNVVVACDERDESQVYGWICAEERPEEICIHFCYVKAPFRKLGIGRELLKTVQFGKPAYYTHETWASQILSSKYNMKFNHYLAEGL